MRRRGELLRSKPELTDSTKQYILIYVNKKQIANRLGTYSSLEEAKEILKETQIPEGTLVIFSDENRILYSEERGSVDAE
tara:strand:+ start:1618 stop:1857 length:240 start_codon:yes stop_codon:yes gene_type:complete